jgi:predicted amidohydrolase
MELTQFVQLLLPDLQAGDWPRSLVVAWDALRTDRNTAVSWSQQTQKAQTSPRLDDFEQWLLNESVDTTALEDRLQRCPCLILAALDRLALRGSSGRRQLLNEPQRYLLGQQTYWLVRRATPYRSETGQAADLNQHLPHWRVIPESFDPRDGARRLRLFESRAVELSFENAPDELVVYLVEFDTDPRYAPDFSQNWVAQELVNEADLAAEALEHLRRATAARADVIVFPELCVSPAVELTIRGYLRGAEHPHRLVVAGSFHVRDGDQYFNQALVLDPFGNEIADWRHRKLTAVSLQRGKISEGITRATELRVAATPCGLQAVVICLDLAQAQPWEAVPLEDLALDWLWVPSWSKNTHAHQAKAKECLKFQSTTTACANQRLPGEAMGTSFVIAVNAEQIAASTCYPAQVHRVRWR